MATAAAAVLSTAARDDLHGSARPATRPDGRMDATGIPRWRGFNLQEMFGWGRKPRRFSELDFELMAEWGFNFVRLPMSYWNWADPNDWLTIREAPLRYVDQAIELGKRYGIHVNLNFHRVPGYCVTHADWEPMRLFHGPEKERRQALAAAAHHWRHFASRYKGIGSDRLSFDLINEPPYCVGGEPFRRWIQQLFPDFAHYVIVEREYEHVVRTLVSAIREVDPDRLIFADGVNIGRKPVHGIADLGVVQSTRGYDPISLTHYRASWVTDAPPWLSNRSAPTWPLRVRLSDFKHGLMGLVVGCGLWDERRLRRELIDPWKKIEAKGVKVHVGECGVYNQTPHDVALAWMRDALSLWKEAGWGYALWEFHGTFGVLDSQRPDVKYENVKGHALDRKMLALLQEH